MDTLTIFDKIMYELATKNIVDKRALWALSKTRYPVNKQIARAIDLGYIQRKSYTVTSGRRQKTSAYYYLTPYGFLYVKKRMLSSVPWTFHIGSFERIRIFNSSSYSKSAITSRFIKITTAALMADCIGAKESTIYLSDYASEKADSFSTPPAADVTEFPALDSQQENEAPYDVWEDDDDLWGDELYADILPGEDITREVPDYPAPLLADLVRGAIFRHYLGRGNRGDSGIIFMDSISIKNGITESAIKNGLTVPDLRGGRYAGVLDSNTRMAMIYNSTELTPLMWRLNFRQRELAAYSGTRRLFFDHDHADREANAIMLISEAAAFVASYNPTDRRRLRRSARGEEIVELGEGFRRFWVVPVSYDGTIELHSIMTTDTATEMQNVIESLELEGEYFRNDDALASTFPLKNDFDALVAVCLHLEVRTLKHLEHTIRRFPQFSYIVLCKDWLRPYIEAVLPKENVEIRELAADSERSQRQDEHSPAEMKMVIEKEAELQLSNRQ